MANTAKRSSKGIKRRNERNILTFYEKIAVIRYYDETNISRNSLAKMFHCCATQIRRILDRKVELLQQLATLSEADASIIIEEMTRKRRKFEMSAISFILHQWVERCRQLKLTKSITNQTLKETALKMAAILNLPTFRPSYRWLNRFRGKYKYNEQDLGITSPNTESTQSISGELSVEDIIIEFKDSLPSFMQKEISAITSSAKVDEKLTTNETTEAPLKISTTTTINEMSRTINETLSKENSEDFDISGDEIDDDDEVIEINAGHKITNSRNNTANKSLPTSAKEENNCNSSLSPFSSANEQNIIDIKNISGYGTSMLLQNIFPHLAVIHQFALLNSDVKALELISQLGVHMQAQAAEGAYKQLSTTTNGINLHFDAPTNNNIYADLDDIILIE